MNQRIMDALIDLDRRFNKLDTLEEAEGYVRDLEDLPEEIVVRAINECRLSKTFFPQVGEIRELAADLMVEGFEVDPVVAFGEVLSACRTYGCKRTGYWHNGKHHDPEPIPWSSPVVAWAVEAFGFTEICTADIKTHNTLRAQFRDTIKDVQTRMKRDIVTGRAAIRGTALPEPRASGPARSIADIGAAMIPERFRGGEGKQA